MTNYTNVLQLRMEMFQNCPAACKHCYQSQEKRSNSLPSPLFQKEKVLKNILEEFLQQGGKSISLTGGEPLTKARWKTVINFLAMCSDMGIQDVRINTSLLYTDTPMLDDLAALSVPKLRIQTGIDGRSVHDYIRFKGAMDATLNNLIYLKEQSSLNLSVRTTLFFGCPIGDRPVDNLGDLKEVVRICKKIGIKRLKTKVVHPTGNLLNADFSFNELWRQKSETTLADALLELIQSSLEDDPPLYLLLTNPLPERVLRMADKITSPFLEIERCECGSSNIAIDADGYVYKCLYNFGKYHLALGHIKEGLSSFLNSPSRLQYSHNAREGACGAFFENLTQCSPTRT